MSQIPYSSAGARMAALFPIWTRINQDRGSLGARFLDAFGAELDQAQDAVAQILASGLLEMLDASQVYEVLAADLPEQAVLTQSYRIYADNEPVTLHSWLHTFYTAAEPAAYVERSSRTVYLRNVSGRIAFVQKGLRVWLVTRYHHVWNDFDEFGLLLGLERLPREDNESFRTRLRTVGFVPPGASKERLVADWARRLGLVSNLPWKDDEPLLIPGALPYACFVDGLPYPAAPHPDGALLEPSENASGALRSVTALIRIPSSPLWARKDDPWLYGHLFDAWGEAKPAYRAIVQAVGQRAPILWSEIRANEALWEAGSAVQAGLGALPSRSDPPLSRLVRLRNATEGAV